MSKISKLFPHGIGDNDAKKCLYSSGSATVGQLIDNSSRFTFSSQYRNCLWIPRGEYGPEMSKLCEEWEHIRDTPAERGWAKYGGEDNSEKERAFVESGGPAGIVPGTESVGLWHLVFALIGWRDARGVWPSANEKLVSNSAKFYPQALQIAERLYPKIPPLYRQWNSYHFRSAVAKEKDNAYAAQFSAEDGPACVKVIAVESNAGYLEDPQCFNGDSWIVVSPPTAEEEAGWVAEREAKSRQYYERSLAEALEKTPRTPLEDAKFAATLAALLAPGIQEDYLPYVRAALTFWDLEQSGCLQRDNTRESFQAAEQQIKFRKEFRLLTGREFNFAADKASFEEIKSLVN